jgi:hypothetical protein
MFLDDQCPARISGQKSSMKSTRLIKAYFYLVQIFIPAAQADVGSAPQNKERRIKQRTSVFSEFELHGVLAPSDHCAQREFEVSALRTQNSYAQSPQTTAAPACPFAAEHLLALLSFGRGHLGVIIWAWSLGS